MEEYLDLISQMDGSQRNYFQAEYRLVHKDETAAFMLCLFLGWTGGHHYYLGNPFSGLLCTFFFWTFIPCMISVVELFFVSGYVRKENRRNAERIVRSMRQMSWR